ncbi:MAG TPA: aspartate aminotransferase family protein [Thermomicrobiales bacterium]|nr:aspartate aminotransferase family protein [Thermomicrobiales bacterium]
MDRTSNASIMDRAQQVIPGGVNSTNRRLEWPLVTTRTAGAYFTDADGNRYLDYHAAFGPLVLGHNHPRVNAAVQQAMSDLDLMGVGVTEQEVVLAETITRHVPGAERVLLTNSGSEATYAALRLARAATGREHIVKFQGTYHGWHDAVLMNVITPAEKIGQKDPLSPGMLRDTVDKTIVLPFNDAEMLRTTLREQGDTIAAVFVEIIPHNIGCVLPSEEFLSTLRRETEAAGSLLIFDEVVTGFRHSLGGYQSIVGVQPDLSTFAKAMANGYPIAALTGKATYMDMFGPGGVFFAGTYNGHPMSVAASLATIAELEDGSVYEHTFGLAERAATGIQDIANERGIPVTVARYGSVFVPYFMEGPIETYTDLLRNDTAMDVAFRQGMCDRGIFMLPTALKRNHVSAAHTESDIDRTLEMARVVLSELPVTV